MLPFYFISLVSRSLCPICKYFHHPPCLRNLPPRPGPAHGSGLCRRTVVPCAPPLPKPSGAAFLDRRGRARPAREAGRSGRLGGGANVPPLPRPGFEARSISSVSGPSFSRMSAVRMRAGTVLKRTSIPRTCSASVAICTARHPSASISARSPCLRAATVTSAPHPAQDAHQRLGDPPCPVIMQREPNREIGSSSIAIDAAPSAVMTAFFTQSSSRSK